MSKVMAVILNYNSADDTKKCVDYLKKQEYTGLEICVIDNHSTEGAEELEEYAKHNQILCIVSEENKGFSAGNNIGLKKANEMGCEYAMIINPDVELRDEKYISRAISKMDEDKTVAVLGTDIINKKGQHQNPSRELHFFEETFWPYIILRNRLRKKLPYVKNYKRSGTCEKLSGCCFFIRMDFIKQAGYLDEKVFMYSEEALLAAQIKEHGCSAYYLADITAYHMHKDKKGKANEQSIKRFFESRRYFLTKTNRYGKLGNKIALKSIGIQEKSLLKKNS